MADTAVLTGNNLTIDDNGGSVFNTAGVTIAAASGGTAGIQSLLSPLIINAQASPTASITLTTSAGDSGAILYLDGDNGSGTFGVALSANKAITVTESVWVTNGNSSGNWVLTAPTVALKDGSEIASSNGTDVATLTIHTNNLNLGNDSNGSTTNIKGNGITIDDNGGTVFTTTGLTIQTTYSDSEYIDLWCATFDQRYSKPDFIFAAYIGWEYYFGPVVGWRQRLKHFRVVLTANSTITVDQNLDVQDVNSGGTWVVTAPTVAVNAFATLDTYHSLTIHTNNLNLGNGSNNNSAVVAAAGVTIDDNGGSVFATTGLTITVFSLVTGQHIVSDIAPLVINATASPSSSLLITAVGQNGALLLLDGANGSGTPGVAMTANNTITYNHFIVTSNDTLLADTPGTGRLQHQM